MGTTEYLTLCTRCMNRSRYKRVQLFVCVCGGGDSVCKIAKYCRRVGIALVRLPRAFREPAHNNGCGPLSKMDRCDCANEI